jgi:type IV pilus assembly protein PilE
MLNRKKKSGYTLVEVMIVIAIVAILVGLALPSYQNSVRKGRRADAQTDMLRYANLAEREYTRNNSYAAAALPDGDKDGDGTDDFYTYTFVVDPDFDNDAWTIRATPTTHQAKDGCGTMTLTHTGQRTKTGTEAGCW